MKEISITEIGPVYIGQTEDRRAATGCTVFVCPEGMAAGADVRGGGPSSREPLLLDPLMAAERIHAVVLAGGSSFGLGASDGVMKLLEERGIGFDVAVTRVPLVVQSDIFDLTVADPFTRPDAAMGYEAARLALDSPNYADGSFGAGVGATVGKICGMDRCMKGGIGSFAVENGDLRIGAVSVVNALGDVYSSDGRKIAGLLNEEKTGFADTTRYMLASRLPENKFLVNANTTLTVVITNALLSKRQLCKTAGMAHNGYARSIRPVHTSADGDTVYAVSCGSVTADPDVVGILAAEVTSRAIERAVLSARSAYGYPSSREIIGSTEPGD